MASFVGSRQGTAFVDYREIRFAHAVNKVGDPYRRLVTADYATWVCSVTVDKPSRHALQGPRPGVDKWAYDDFVLVRRVLDTERAARILHNLPGPDFTVTSLDEAYVVAYANDCDRDWFTTHKRAINSASRLFWKEADYQGIYPTSPGTLASIGLAALRGKLSFQNPGPATLLDVEK